LGSLLGAESAKECLRGSVTRRSLRDSVCQPLFPTSPFGNLALPASAGGPLSLQRFPSGERAPALWQRAPGGGRCPSLRWCWLSSRSAHPGCRQARISRLPESWDA